MFADSIKEINKNNFPGLSNQLIDIETYSLNETIDYIINNSDSRINF